MSTVLPQHVFGVSRESLRSFVDREAVDKQFVDALKSDNQIVVYGASKQGKTSLVRRHLKEDEYIAISLSPKAELKDIYRSILRKHDILVETKIIEATGGKSEASAKAKISVKIPLAGEIGGEFGGKQGGESSRSAEYAIDFNLEFAQDVADLIGRCERKKWIVLDNFHYLREELQRSFAFDLRVFHDCKVQFIILGVWSEKNRLAQYNGDLVERVTEITVEPWTENDLRRIAEKGCNALGRSISNELLARAIESCVGSVAIFQELMLGIVRSALASGSLEKPGQISLQLHHKQAIEEKLKEYSGRIRKSLESLSSPSMKNGDPRLISFLFRVIFAEPPFYVAKGFEEKRIKERVQSLMSDESDDLEDQIVSMLNRLATIQAESGISPPLIDFDFSCARMRVVDLTLLFLIMHQPKQELMSFLA